MKCKIKSTILSLQLNLLKFGTMLALFGNGARAWLKSSECFKDLVRKCEIYIKSIFQCILLRVVFLLLFSIFESSSIKNFYFFHLPSNRIFHATINLFLLHVCVFIATKTTTKIVFLHLKRELPVAIIFFLAFQLLA